MSKFRNSNFFNNKTFLYIGLLTLLLIFPSFLIGQVMQKDGSVLDNTGEKIRSSYAERYQRALKAFNNGKKVKGWPTVKIINGKPLGRKGYVGEQMLKEGAPLFIRIGVDSDQEVFLKGLAKQNGFSGTDMLNLTIIVNANDKFIEEKKIDKVQITKLQESYGTLVSSGVLGADLSKFELDQRTGLLINDSDIVLDGIDVSASLDEIADIIGVDRSLVTSRAMAETLISSGPPDGDSGNSGDSGGSGGSAIDESTGAAPRP